MAGETKADRKLDCLGLFCPEPVFRTRLELDKMRAGETLEVWADDPAAEKDIQSLVKRLGHSILNMRREGNRIHFLIRKGSQETPR
jgi:tRNA 2-thiouridine synthesizing protein A